MYSHVTEDFHSALLALQEMEMEGNSETPAEVETGQLVDQVFAFLDTIECATEDTFASFDKIAA